jgi:CRISPR-associated protein Csd2
MSISDPSKRQEFVLLFDATNSNPNGDPDWDNHPRQDHVTGHGLVTDVALKRKIRDFATLEHGESIFIQSGQTLNSRILQGFQAVGLEPRQVRLTDDEVVDWFEARSPAGFSVELEEDEAIVSYLGEAGNEKGIRDALLEEVEGELNAGLRTKLVNLARQLANAKGQKPTPAMRGAARENLCQSYYDVRMFGAVLQTGLNAGQVRGPAQISFARSRDPVEVVPFQLTRQARTTARRLQTGDTEFGRKTVVLYGLYRAHGYFTPAFARDTGVTIQDLEIFWHALSNLFQYDRSAARPEMEVRGLYVFTHESGLGNAPAHKLFERIGVEKREGVEAPRSFKDYAVSVNDKNLPAGVTLTRLEG